MRFTGLISALVLALSACSGGASDAGEARWVADGLSGKIIIAGDSTAADYPLERKPQIGWGQVLDHYLADGVRVENRAVNGRSTKSYIDEGKWASLIETVEHGDVVFISFGHNDSRDDAPTRYAAADGAYKANLIRFVKDVEGRAGVPVVLSSAARRLWEGPAMVETHGLYRVNAEKAAAESGAFYIDLAQLSLAYFETIGREGTKDDFLWLTPETGNAKFPEGVEDNTHFQENGACGVARVIANNLAVSGGKLASFVDATTFTDEVDGANRPVDIAACAAEAWN